MTEITKEQAISVLIQAAKIGQSKGAFSLEDAGMIVTAIKTLAPMLPQQEVANEDVVTDEASEVTESGN
jgi:hypothetical protein